MKLSEIFEQLTYGELSQISLGGGEVGELSENNYARLIPHINLGLLALYKRFPIKEARVNIPLQPGISSYLVTPPDLLKIERVYTDAEYELPLNDEGSSWSCFTPSATVLRIPSLITAQGADLPDAYRTSSFTVVYRANHGLLTVDTVVDPTTTEIELPYSHLEPLLYFVASRINNPIGMTNEFHAGNSYAAKYEQACQQLEQFNLRVDQGSQNSRLQRNGWV